MTTNISNDSDNKKIETNWKETLNELFQNSAYGSKWQETFSQYEEISYNDAKKVDSNYNHAAHAFIYAKHDGKLWNIPLNASIMMQLRFDGFIGFPGGFIDHEESWEEGLNRKLEEEINLNPKYYFKKEDHLFSSCNHESKLILHFYSKKVSYEEFNQIERNAFLSRDYGSEVMGLIRPPLYETHRSRGFSIFLQNKFIGNALFQLLKSINLLEIIPTENLINHIRNVNNLN